MINRTRILSLAPTAALLVTLLVNRAPAAPPAVIFDTDMGSDCDDAGALAILHALADAGEVRILGVIFSSGKNRYGVGTCDAINTYYGRGNLPLGQYKGDDVGDPKDHYCKRIATDRKFFGHDLVDEAPDLVPVYRTILASQPDRSVTILTVGHPHALVHLLRNPQTAELVRAKVDRWVAMGTGGWNFRAVGMAAYSAELLEKWPLPVYVSPRGKDIITGNRLLPKTPGNNPVREAYRLWGNALRKGRSSWDQVAVLSLVRPHLFNVEEVGRLERTPKGDVVWNRKVDNPQHFLVIPRVSKEELARTIEGLMACPPHRAMRASQDKTTGQLIIYEGSRPVVQYNYKTVTPPEGYLEQVSAGNRKYALPRSNYIHPLYGPERESLTYDWSKDHPHHRGIYWAWPEVQYAGQIKDLHALQGVFARPTGATGFLRGEGFAEIQAENQWLWEDKNPIVTEETTIRAWQSTKQGRFIDLTFSFTALVDGVTLARRGTNLYGGLNVRLSPIADLKLLHHADPADARPRQAWQAAAGTWKGATKPAALVIFEKTTNPYYPADYIQYPYLPWFQPTFPKAGIRHPLKKNEPLVLRYRLWIKGGAAPAEEELREQWRVYQTATPD